METFVLIEIIRANVFGGLLGTQVNTPAVFHLLFPKNQSVMSAYTIFTVPNVICICSPNVSQEVHSTFPRTENGRVCEPCRDNHLLNACIKDSKHAIDSLADAENTKKDGSVQGPG